MHLGYVICYYNNHRFRTYIKANTENDGDDGTEPKKATDKDNKKERWNYKNKKLPLRPSNLKQPILFKQVSRWTAESDCYVTVQTKELISCCL